MRGGGLEGNEDLSDWVCACGKALKDWGERNAGVGVWCRVELGLSIWRLLLEWCTIA